MQRATNSNAFAPRALLGASGALAFALGVSLFTGGCATERVSLARGPREYVPSDYTEILKRWTRDESLINVTELDTPLTVTATFETWDFRWAYVIRYAQDYRLTVEQRRTLLEQTLKESSESHQFYVALYGSTWRWADLTRPNSAWIVRLIDDLGNETAPSEIVHIAKPGALERTYFPYTTIWRQAFRIRFPRVAPDKRPTIAANAHWIGLRFAGAEGNEELRWDLESGTAQSLAAPPSTSASPAPNDSVAQ